MKKHTFTSLPKGWEWREFGTCARLINGRAYAQDELLDSGTPVLRIQNLNGGDRWYYSNLNLPDDKYCIDGDLLYAWSASFGPYMFSGPRSIFHYHIWKIVTTEYLDKRFTYYLLQWLTQSIKSAAHGVAMLHMTKAGMEAWPVPVPPLTEQRRIADVLDRAEALRAKRRAALAELDTLAQSIFLDRFGDPVQNSKNWSRVLFKDLLTDIESGQSPVCLDRSAIIGEWGVLKLGAVTWCEYDPSQNKALPVDVLPDPLLEVRQGDLLFSRKNTYELVAACALVRSTPPRLLLPDLIFRFRLRADASIIPDYLHQLLINPSKRRAIQKLASGTSGSMPNISKGRLLQTQIELPPIALQKQFAEQVAAVERMKLAHRASLAELDSLFSSLQHRAFRGEL